MQYCATQLGMATVASSLSPHDAIWVFSELSKARKNFALENELHLLYQVRLYYTLMHNTYIWAVYKPKNVYFDIANMNIGPGSLMGFC